MLLQMKILTLSKMAMIIKRVKTSKRVKLIKLAKVLLEISDLIKLG
jgi:hypothetical protein